MRAGALREAVWPDGVPRVAGTDAILRALARDKAFRPSMEDLQARARVCQSSLATHARRHLYRMLVRSCGWARRDMGDVVAGGVRHAAPQSFAICEYAAVVHAVGQSD